MDTPVDQTELLESWHLHWQGGKDGFLMALPHSPGGYGSLGQFLVSPRGRAASRIAAKCLGKGLGFLWCLEKECCLSKSGKWFLSGVDPAVQGLGPRDIAIWVIKR